MNLSYDEKFFLSLYLKLYNKEYDLTNNEVYDKKTNFLIRHIEMQNTGYIFQVLNLC